MDTKTLIIDLTTIKGITLGEKQKLKLENHGYNLVHETGFFTQARLTYHKS